MLGSLQEHTITEAAKQCGWALKQLGRSRVRTQAGKAINEKDPEKGIAQLVEVSFRASVLNLGEAARAALPALQQNYWRVVDAWMASASEKHRNEMVRLFKRELKR